MQAGEMRVILYAIVGRIMGMVLAATMLVMTRGLVRAALGERKSMRLVDEPRV